MKPRVVALVVGLCLSSAVSGPASAGGTIEKACLGSDRSAANRTLCTCIQKVADAVLSSSEQRRGAAFFTDPHASQELRASGRRADEAFWEKWKVFGATAQKYCD